VAICRIVLQDKMCHPYRCPEFHIMPSHFAAAAASTTATPTLLSVVFAAFALATSSRLGVLIR